MLPVTRPGPGGLRLAPSGPLFGRRHQVSSGAFWSDIWVTPSGVELSDSDVTSERRTVLVCSRAAGEPRDTGPVVLFVYLMALYLRWAASFAVGEKQTVA